MFFPESNKPLFTPTGNTGRIVCLCFIFKLNVDTFPELIHVHTYEKFKLTPEGKSKTCTIPPVQKHD